MIESFFPFFPQGKTRQQFLSRTPNVQVKSCWNGMGNPSHSSIVITSTNLLASLNAAPFQDETLGLRFRSISSSLSLQTGHLEGSEACLIHADMQAHWRHLPQSSFQIFVNPLVRVSYTKTAHNLQNSVLPLFLETVGGQFVALIYDIRDWLFSHQLARYKAEREEKVREWERTSGQKEIGEYCLTDNLQILTPQGWEIV
jgi:hypothetical protein